MLKICRVEPVKEGIDAHFLIPLPDEYQILLEKNVLETIKECVEYHPAESFVDKYGKEITLNAIQKLITYGEQSSPKSRGSSASSQKEIEKNG